VGAVEGVKGLIAAGANVTTPNQFGLTPLRTAFVQGQEEVANILKDYFKPNGIKATSNYETVTTATKNSNFVKQI
jgi:ankyrin repeat protein